MVHTAQLCPLHLTPDWRRSSWWRSCSPLAFVCCIGNYLKSCGALCGKRIRFNARRNAPRVPSGTSSIKVKCTCIGRHAPLSCVPPLCQHHLLRESFFNTSCIADIMKWPPDRPTDGSLPQSPWNTVPGTEPLIFPSMPLSIRLPCALPSLRLHLATISLYAHLFFPSFSLDSRSLSTFIISLGVCFAPAPSPPACTSSPPAIDHCGRPACRVMSCSICPV